MIRLVHKVIIVAVAIQLFGCDLFNYSPFSSSGHTSNCINADSMEISTPVTVNGLAVFKRRRHDGNHNTGLGAVDKTDYPIRFAEVEVSLNDTVVGCTTTDESGHFTIDIPNHKEEFVLKVNSISPRIANSFGHIFIQESPFNDKHYSISQKINPDELPQTVKLVAEADDQQVLGGAFNILDKIIETNLFLKEMTLDCDDECKTFSSTPDVHAYWIAGFAPSNYFGSTSEVSFFNNDNSQIYILGGSNGEIFSSDTDHFDDEIIVHEYAHFVLSDIIGIFSPGVHEHDIDVVKDPRHAFYEGFATFLAAAVLGKASYVDTTGIGQTGNVLINLDLESYPPKRDVPTKMGEGNFRELSIIRSMWDMLDPFLYNGRMTRSYDQESVNMDFVELWSVLTNGLGSSNNHFKDYGLFLKLQSDRANATPIDELLVLEKQKASREDYAMEYTNCISDVQLSPEGNTTRYHMTNQFSSNDFFMYRHKGGSFTADLEYSNSRANLDLYLYREFYVFGSGQDMAGYSNNRLDQNKEQIRIFDLPAGVYLINVVAMQPGQNTSYNLSVNGDPC